MLVRQPNKVLYKIKTLLSTKIFTNLIFLTKKEFIFSEHPTFSFNKTKSIKFSHFANKKNIQPGLKAHVTVEKLFFDIEQ